MISTLLSSPGLNRSISISRASPGHASSASRRTSRTAGVRFTIRGREHRCWVWSSALVADDEPRPVSMAEKYSRPPFAD